VRSGNVRALAGYFDFLEQMGAGHPPEAAASLLDELIPLAAEPGSRRKGGLDTATSPVSAPAQDLVLSSKVLINAARKYQHPEIALEWFSNRIDLLVENQDFTTLGLLGPDITDFLENLSTPASQESGKKLLTKIQELASQTLQQGQVQMAINLCHMTGSGRDAVIVQLLRQVLVGAEQSPLRAEQSSHGKTIKIPELKQRAEQECWLDFLQEGLASNDRLKVQALPRDLLIKAIFQAAVVVGRTDELWSRLGKPVILPYLDEGWNPEKRGLVEQLLKTIPAGASPAAAVELSLRLLQHTSPADPGWLVLARRIASEAKDSPEAETILGDLLKQVQDRFSDKEQKAFTLGILADVVRGAPGGKKIVAAYDESLSSLEHKESLKLRRKLAESGAASILARDLQRDVIPWDPEEGPKRLQRWRDVILDQHPKVLECLRNEVATRLQRSEQGDAFVPLALELLPREAGGAAGQAAPGAPHPGAPRPATQDVLGLWDGLLLRLPLIPGSLPAGAPRLSRPPANLSPESSQRVRIIQLLAEIQQSARAENWSLADFPSTQPAWAQDVHALNPKEKREVWLWCLGTFTKTGITLSAHAGGLVQALEAIGERAWLSDSVANLLQGRDPVTCILAFTAFVDKGIGSHRPAEWGRYLGEIMARTDKAEQDRLRTVFRLFEEHLLKRFSPKNKGYQEKLVILAEEAGLAVVVKSIRSQFDAVVEKPAGSAKPAGSEGTAAASRETAAPMPGVNDAGKAQDRTQEQAKGPSIVEAPKVAGERLSGTFKRLFGKKDSSTTQDEDIRSKDVPRQEE
jgi:hypothetical protein